MKSLFSLGAAGLALAAATFVEPAQAVPMSAGAIQSSINEAGPAVIDVRYRGGGHHGGGPRWHGRPGHAGNWHRGGNWHGGRNWHGYPGYRGNYWRGRSWSYRGGYGWGYWGVPLVVAPYAAGGCGYVNTRRWVNGHRVWVRRWRCL